MVASSKPAVAMSFADDGFGFRELLAASERESDKKL